MQLLERPTPTTTPPVEGIAAEGRGRRWRRRLRRLTSEASLVFLLTASLYVAVAAYLVLVRHCIFGDALSRVANAQFVLSSRDPHLAAIGFVWNPLPSLVLVPFVPLRGLLPVIFTTGFLGCVSTALFMAGAVAVLRGLLQDLGVPRLPRLLLVTLFALHPMIVIYASNGMSEAPLLLFILLTSRYLLRWLSTRESKDLVWIGLALGGAYMTRYEALAAGLAVLLLIAFVSAVSARGPWAARRSVVFTDVAVVGVPFAMSFVLWAVLSRVIVKQWFPTLQSEYGNSAQVAGSKSLIEQATGTDLSSRLVYASHQLLGLEPLVVVLLGLALLLGLIRRDFRALAPLAVAGAVLAFDLLAFLTGRSFGWLRFQIAVIPMCFLCAGVIVGLLPRRWGLRWGASAIAAALLLPAFVTTVITLTDRSLAREETEALRGALLPDRSTAQELQGSHRWDPAWRVAAYIDADRTIGRGKVLTDAAFSFPVLLAARQTDKYVITPDEDFKPKLADPVTFGVTYLLVPSPKNASFDAINVAYPKAFDEGLPGSKKIEEWRNSSGEVVWRLYRLPAAPKDAQALTSGG